MNYFAHGSLYTNRPYFLAGTAVPDWLNVVNRKVRIRPRHAAPFATDDDPRIADLASGVLQHHEDDAWFHSTTAFNELSWQFTCLARDALPHDEGFRPSFLGHVLVEVLLDSTLIAEDPGRLDAYYEALEAIDGSVVEQSIGRMANQTPPPIASLLPRFISERFLSDYEADDKLCRRLNQVMRRVGLPALPDEFANILPAAREAVAQRRGELMTPATRKPPQGAAERSMTLTNEETRR